MMYEDEIKRTAKVRRAFVVVMVVYSLLLVAITLGTWDSQRTNDAQDQRDAALLACFDRFATDLWQGLTPVRDATKRRDDALRARDDAEAAVFREQARLGAQRLLGNPVGVDDVARMMRTLKAFERADQESDAAASELDTARLRYPYPPPPSVACANVSPTAGE
jgi:hypothetical protein